MKSKYTFDYAENIERLLDESLAEIAREISASKISDNLKFLILGGGYGRGEGGIFRDGDTPKLYNDLDFFVISKTDAADANREIDAFFRDVARRWAFRLGIDVDFGAARNVAYVEKHTNVLMWREMLLGANVVWGDAREFKKLFRISGLLASDEFAKLMMNRCSGMLFARKRLEKTELGAADFDFVSRNINKCLLACGDVFLASRGIYKFNTLDRLAEIENAKIPHELSDLLPLYRAAVEFKKYPSPMRNTEDLQKLYARALNLALRTLETLKYFIKGASSKGLVKKLANFRYWLKVRRYINKFGHRANPFENPVYSSIWVLMLLLKSESVSDAQMADFIEIWNRVN